MSARAALLSFQIELPSGPPGPVLPALGRLLARATPGAMHDGGASDWLLQQLTGNRTQDWLALCLQAGAPLPAATQTCLRVDGVMLAATMNSISMQRTPASVEAADLAALPGLLAETFAAHQAELVHWNGLLLACFRTRLQLQAPALADCAGHELRECLPQGADADRVRRLLTECQMVLHANADPLRMASGPALQAVNGIWLSGTAGASAQPAASGNLTAQPRGAAALLSPLPWLQALAPAPHDALMLAGSGTPVLWHGPADAPDLPTLLHRALQALQRGHLPGITLGLWHDHLGQGRQYRLGRWQALQFWRRTGALPEPVAG